MSDFLSIVTSMKVSNSLPQTKLAYFQIIGGQGVKDNEKLDEDAGGRRLG